MEGGFDIAGLFLTAALIAGFHAAMPSHWMPFVLVGRRAGWTKRRVMGVVLLAGGGHLLSTTVLGLLVGRLGHFLHEAAETVVPAVTLLLFAAAGLFFIVRHFLGHAHDHGGGAAAAKTAAGGRGAVVYLLSILVFSPCEAILPVFLAAGTARPAVFGALVLMNAVITLAGMAFMVNLAWEGAKRLRAERIERYEGLVIGGAFLLLGTATFFFHEWLEGALLRDAGDLLRHVLAATWTMVLASAPFMLLGLFLGGVFHVFFSRWHLDAMVRGRGAGPVLKLAALGVPLPLCSCGVVPAAAALRKRGASKGATVSFLISTPETGPDSIALTWVLLGPFMAVYRPLAALVTAVAGGLLTDAVDRTPDPPPEGLDRCPLCDEPGGRDHRHGAADRLRRIFTYGFGELLGDIAGWFVLGMLLSGVILALPLGPLFAGSRGSGFGTMVLMLLVGIPMYTCATSSTPVAAALIAQGLSPGAALVYLLTGPATNLTTVLVVWKTLGRRATTVYLAALAVVSLAAGYLLNYLAPRFPSGVRFLDGAREVPRWLEIGSAAVFLALVLVVFFRKVFHSGGHDCHHGEDARGETCECGSEEHH
ncbi:MAG: permease [Planctomycetota bacterium]